MENLNSVQYLEKNKTQVLSNLERTGPAPSVQMTAVVGRSTEHQEEEDAMLDDQEADTIGMDQRHTQRQRELRVERPGELFDSEDEDMAAQIGVRPSGKKCRRNERNFKEVNASVSGAAVTSGLAGYAGENDEEFAALAREDNEDVEMDAHAEHHPKKARLTAAECESLMARLG
jgi:histone deacetylase 1/2